MELGADSSIGSYPGGQQANFAGPQAQSPAGYNSQPMGFAAPPSAGGYGRGQSGPNAGQQQQQQQQQWAQAPAGQNFNNGFAGYQG